MHIKHVQKNQISILIGNTISGEKKKIIVHGLNFVIFNFLENNDFFWSSVEACEFVNSVT